MLEKIGLPPKPSLRGNIWVVDASHCQGCSSQFTFINRKHHCRRCGGIFCGSCTQQRMILRGQGDSPVRICDPCKKLEDATRFEMRHRHKSKASKGGSGVTSVKEDLNESLGHDEMDLLADKTSVGSSSNSNIHERLVKVVAGGSDGNPSTDQASAKFESDTPENLRKKALAAKKKYRSLKDEGKSEEALRAYKMGKELERQAAALELSLRKNHRKSLNSSTANEKRELKDHFRTASEKIKPSIEKIKENDGLSAELRELGWSELDLHVVEKKPASLSLEGELSSLLSEDSDKPKTLKPTSSPDKSQVLTHKKKALELKRAGNLAEAKEELKKAKILERKIEEEELLGDRGDDSEDEILKMIQSMDADVPDQIFTKQKPDIGFNIPSLGADFDIDGNFSVTDEDMDDPEIASALKSLGWNFEDSEGKDQSDVLNQKSTGNTAQDTVVLLKNAENETLDSYGVGDNVKLGSSDARSKSKLTVQKELIGLKKKALTLRRQGKFDESEQELKKSKVVEAELEELMNKTGQESCDEVVTDQDMQDSAYLSVLKKLGWQDEESAQVMMDGISKEKAAAASSTVTPRRSKREIERDLLLLKRKALALRRQGDTEAADEVLNKAKPLEAELATTEDESGNNWSQSARVDESGNSGSQSRQGSQFADQVTVEKPEPAAHLLLNVQENSSHHADLQQKIVHHKRKAVALKREGKLGEAKKELMLAKLLEKRVDEEKDSSTANNASSPKSLSSRERFKLQQESLGHKRQALKLRREGKIAEAEAELELAKSLESQLQEMASTGAAEVVDDVSVEDFLDPLLLSALHSIGFKDDAPVPRPT